MRGKISATPDWQTMHLCLYAPSAQKQDRSCRNWRKVSVTLAKVPFTFALPPRVCVALFSHNHSLARAHTSKCRAGSIGDCKAASLSFKISS